MNQNAAKKTTISLAAARLSIVAAITYQVVLFALILIRPDLDPSWRTVSEWARGPYGWIMSMAFLISGLSYGSLLVAIRSQMRGPLGKIGLGILLICAVGLVGAGVFTTDPMDDPTKPLTTTGTLHLISAMTQLMLLPFAALLLNLSLAFKNPEWTRARRTLLLTASLPLLGLIGFVVHMIIYVIPLGDNAHGPGVPLGWPPRFLFVIYMVWLIALAWEAIKVRNPNAS